MQELKGKNIDFVKILKQANKPLETKEIMDITKLTRAVIHNRLMELVADGKVKGERKGGVRGIWIWWL